MDLPGHARRRGRHFFAAYAHNIAHAMGLTAPSPRAPAAPGDPDRKDDLSHRGGYTR